MEKLKEIYQKEEYKHLFIRSIINASSLFATLLVLVILSHPSTVNGSIEEIFFIPIIVFGFSGWIISAYFEDRKEKQSVIKRTIVFVVLMTFLFDLLGIFNFDTTSTSQLTIDLLVFGIFEIWLCS